MIQRENDSSIYLLPKILVRDRCPKNVSLRRPSSLYCSCALFWKCMKGKAIDVVAAGASVHINVYTVELKANRFLFVKALFKIRIKTYFQRM